MRWLFRVLALIFFARAVSRGPGKAAGYMARRAGRKALWRMTRRW
jgi:hypothetical protein